MLLFKNQNMKVFTTLSDKKKRSAMSILRPTLCTLLLVFSSLLLFQCGDEAEDFFKGIEDALENLAPSFGDKTTIADQTYTQNREISTLSLPEATGGEAPLTYSLEPDLPTGLSFDATTREITGTPTVAAAETEYTYTATDANSLFVDLTFMITVTAVTQGADPVPPGLIPISTLEQLNAIRYDLNGNGKVDDKGGLENIAAAETAYAAVFPGVAYDANDTDKYTGYKLMKDLDFTVDASYSNATTNKPKWTPNSMTTPTNEGWEPIGFYSSIFDNASFTGDFDGQGNTISNLFINRSSTRYVGLFGYVGSGGAVKNVGLQDPVVTGDDDSVGGLVGWNNGGIITACYVSGGTVTGTGGYTDAGGLVGENESGTISACYVSGGTVTGTGGYAIVGGLVGQSGGSISASYVSGGTVTSTGDDSDVGGLVGQSGGSISASYVSGGTMTGTGDDSNVGGLAGENYEGIITACYVSGGTVTSTGAGNVGGLVGENDEGTITACYAGGDYAKLVGTGSGTVTNSYHQLAAGGTEDATSKFEATLKAPTAYTTPPNNIYANWNVDVDGTAGGDDPWDFGDNDEYPVLNGIDADGDGDTDADDIAAQRS